MTKSITRVGIFVPTWLYSTLLHFEGADASTTITDSSGNNLTWTVHGNAQIDTAQFKVGAASCLFDGTGDYLTGPQSLLAFGTADFTIDFWVRFNSVAGTQFLIDSRAGISSVAICLLMEQDANSPSNAILRFFTNNAYRITGTTPLVINTWYRVTLSRVSGSTRLFVNGVQQGLTYADANDYSLANTASFTYVGIITGASSPTSEFNGWMDEFSVVAGTTVFRFTIDSGTLPTIVAGTPAIPSIKEVTIEPAIVGLGTDLGQRGTITVTFKDHKYKFANESFDSGTFWGKFRARYGLKLRGRSMFLYRATYDAPDTGELRWFVVDSVNGPAANGEYKVIAKDVLKLADDDRSQAPRLSNGFLIADITNVATTATLSPAGIGNQEYPASQFFVTLGGNEVAFVTSRAGDVLTFETSPSGRGMFNTAAVAHTAGDRVQVGKYINGQDVANIINDLLVNYSGVPSSYIPLTDWLNETSTNLGVVYTAFLGEPVGVNALINELIEQAALAIWWDDVNQIIRLQVLRSVVGASSFTMNNLMKETMQIQEQPDKRLSQVYVYFGKINPLVEQDQIANYRSTSLSIDGTSEIDYGSAAIKKIYSRWIPAGGRTTAQTMGNKLLGRYRDPPRRFNFDLMRYAQDMPLLGGGYSLQSWQLQDYLGTSASVPIQIFRLNPGPDVLKIEAEEMLWTPFGGDVDPSTRTIVFDSSENNVNLRTRHDQLFPAPTAGKTINAYINSGVVIGSANASLPAFDVGSWPGGVTVNLIVVGRIQGCGGKGGQGAGIVFVGGIPTLDNAHSGDPGGVALYTRQAIGLTSTSGAIWGGGGGGGGGGASVSPHLGGCGGGGGAGTVGGFGGLGGVGSDATGIPGDQGTATGGGNGGVYAAFPTKGPGGNGGSPGNTGSAGGNGDTTTAAGGGVNGAGIDGTSFTTDVGAPGDIRGGRIN